MHGAISALSLAFAFLCAAFFATFVIVWKAASNIGATPPDYVIAQVLLTGAAMLIATSVAVWLAFRNYLD